MHIDHKVLVTLAMCGALTMSCRPRRDRQPTPPPDPLLAHASSISAGEHHTIITATSLQHVLSDVSRITGPSTPASIERLLTHHTSALGIAAPTTLDAWGAAGVKLDAPLSLIRYADAHVLVLPLSDHDRWRAHMSEHTGRPIAELDDFAPRAFQAGDDVVWMFDGEHIFLTEDDWLDFSYLLCRGCQNVPLPALSHDATYASFARALSSSGQSLGAYTNSALVARDYWESDDLIEDAKHFLTRTSSPSVSVGAHQDRAVASVSVTNPLFRELLTPTAPSLSLDTISATTPNAMLRISTNKQRLIPLLGLLLRSRREFFELDSWFTTRLSRPLQEVAFEPWTGEIYLAAYNNQSGLGQTTWDVGKTSLLAALVFEDAATVSDLEALWRARRGGDDDAAARGKIIFESEQGQLDAIIYVANSSDDTAPPNIFFVDDRILLAGSEVPAEAIQQWAWAPRSAGTRNKTRGEGVVDFARFADTASLLFSERDAALLAAPSSPASITLSAHEDTLTLSATFDDTIDLAPSARVVLNDLLLERARDEYYDVLKEIEYECAAHLDSMRGGADDPMSSDISWGPTLDTEPTPDAPLTFPGGTSYALTSSEELPTGGEMLDVGTHGERPFIPEAFSTRAGLLMRYTYETGPGDGVHATVTLRAEADLDPETAETLKIEQLLSIDPETRELVVSPILESPEF